MQLFRRYTHHREILTVDFLQDTVADHAVGNRFSAFRTSRVVGKVDVLKGKKLSTRIGGSDRIHYCLVDATRTGTRRASQMRGKSSSVLDQHFCSDKSEQMEGED